MLISQNYNGDQGKRVAQQPQNFPSSLVRAAVDNAPPKPRTLAVWNDLIEERQGNAEVCELAGPEPGHFF